MSNPFHSIFILGSHTYEGQKLVTAFLQVRTRPSQKLNEYYVIYHQQKTTNSGVTCQLHTSDNNQDLFKSVIFVQFSAACHWPWGGWGVGVNHEANFLRYYSVRFWQFLKLTIFFLPFPC